MTATSEMLRIMPREMRLMSERILSLTDLPKGFALMVGDVVMHSQAMGLGGFTLLEQRLETLRKADPAAIALVSDEGARLRLNAGGQHAWFVVASALDLLDETLAFHDRAVVEIENVLDPAELGIAAGLGRRTGLAVELDGNSLSATAAPDRTDPVLAKVLENGCAIPADQWWRIYELAQTALAPDSPVSRRHAGPVIVTEDGQIIGRTDNDDDTDVHFITNIRAPAQEACS